MSPQPKSGQKTYILDTNILIHDPDAITGFGDNHVRVPVEVIQELDRIKTEQSDRGYGARNAVKNLLSSLGIRDSSNAPVWLPGGGTLNILVPPFDHDTDRENRIRRIIKNVGGDMVSVDNRIMAACLREMADVSGHSGGEVVLVTKDGAMSIKAHGAGIPVEDYRNDKVSHEDARVTDTQTIDIRRPEAHQFGIDSEIYLSDGRSDSLNLNEYVILRDDKDGKEIPARYFGRGLFRTLIGQNGFSVSGGIHIKPRNIEQSFLVDALLDTSIDLVTISGPAGTGKTILSMAAGLHSVAGGRYTRLSITRPIIGVGNDIGFLPGNIEEKMTPWLQGYSDSADVLFTRAGAPQDKPQSERKAKAKNARENARKSNGTPARGSGDKGLLERAARIKPFNDLIARGILEVQAITHIRGRSIPDSILMLDEAQNTNAHQIKTVVTRMARNSKLILSGDPAQIDSPWVDARSNGLIHVRTRMRNLPNVAHVVLKSGERSPLAEMAARML